MPDFPFLTNIYRVFPEIDVIVLRPDIDPPVVCITAHSPGDRAIALALLKQSPASFVLTDGLRYSPDGAVERYDPTCPASAAELRLTFDMEWVELGPPPRVYLFIHTKQEWEDARKAMRHLLQQGLLSPQSYIESDHTGQDQGLSAHNLDAASHGAELVALFREAAYCVQNDLYEKEVSDEE